MLKRRLFAGTFDMTESSKVIHIRNVGHEISENDLLQLLQPFGVVTKLVMLRAKNQVFLDAVLICFKSFLHGMALLQMHDMASAVNALQYYANIQPSVRGRNVYIQFSSHQELTTMDNSQGRSGGDQFFLLFSFYSSLFILLSLFSSVSLPVCCRVLSGFTAQSNSLNYNSSTALSYNSGSAASSILSAWVCGEDRHFSEVSWFFRTWFFVGFQALVQFQSRQSAVSARNSLQGRNIYDGCCQLDIQFSNLSELQVNYNNERSRDFTNPSLPSGESKGRSSQPGYGDAASLYALQPPGARVAFQQVGDKHSGVLSEGFPDKHMYGVHMGNAAAVAAAFGGGLPPGISGTNERCTVLVSNLNPDKIDEDKLFNLFSIYGNIVRIKLLRNKPDHALVQMGDGFQAELAVHFLKGAMLLGKRLEVNFSKHPNITAGPDTHEYTNSNLNRYNRNASKNYRYCCSPTKMIHLSSLPQEITEEDIVAYLEEHGSIINTKLFEVNGKKQALIQFDNEEQATEALVCKHATTVDRSVIRISFSQLQTI
ncbi:hypothetical protein Syun_013767 [Stephania yunnanensis]|uniref:RRM domain-containing protein n=1 Tax=Stephania yunnanensis TaxID=152371 RepID=A0AAP0P7Y0_9MAGN